MTEPEILGPEATPNRQDTLLKICHVIYGLQALAYFTGGMTGIVAIVINYIKADDVRGTWLEPHFRWQRRTFWIGLAWAVIGAILAIVGIGFLLLFALFVWLVYRVAKGWLALMDRKTVG
jgi:uncharacterized membrane protein